MRVHTGSGIGTSGNMTILMRREPGRGSPLTDVGGAWMPSEYLGGKSLAYLELGIPQLVYLRLLQDPSMVLYLLLGQGPIGGWHPAPCGAVGISPKLLGPGRGPRPEEAGDGAKPKPGCGAWYGDATKGCPYDSCGR